MTEPDIMMVIVAFGHATELPATLRSIAAQDYPQDRLHVVVVDNGDGESAAAARATAPEAQVIEPGENLGFAGGCNLAVAATGAPTIMLINPDMELRPAFTRTLVGALQEPGVGVAGARLLFPDGATLQHAGGELCLPLALTSHRGHGKPAATYYCTPDDVAYVTGAALALRRATWAELGGFDETFCPAYYEEVDLCLRARTAGLRVRYIPDAVATHRETSALGRTSIAYYRLYHANRLRLLFKHWENDWLAAEWLPAELAHLRTTADDHEIDGLLWSYRAWQSYFLAGGAGTDLRLDGWDHQPAPGGPPPGSELAWTLSQAAAKRTITPLPFVSSVPGLARLRGWWNRAATEEYLRPLLQQQNDLNAALVELGAALERQRRTADGAILCQGMLLAKVLATRFQTSSQ